MSRHRDYYREWSYADRCDASREGNYEAVEQWDRDNESSNNAYDNWRNGGEYSDPDYNGRFH